MMIQQSKYILAGLALLSLVACDAGKNQTNVELIQDMMDQISIKAQDAQVNDPSGTAMRVPPEGTVSREHIPYMYPTDPIAAENNLKNPFSGELSPEVVSLGGKNYEIYCGVCHGMGGAGDGPVAEKMALRPPSLLTDKVKNFNDGRIFHIITMGQGVMGSYLNQIPNEKARWAIVNYVRTLQKKSEAQ